VPRRDDGLRDEENAGLGRHGRSLDQARCGGRRFPCDGEQALANRLSSSHGNAA
jgi:hypothetical protein